MEEVVNGSSDLCSDEGGESRLPQAGALSV